MTSWGHRSFSRRTLLHGVIYLFNCNKITTRVPPQVSNIFVWPEFRLSLGHFALFMELEALPNYTSGSRVPTQEMDVSIVPTVRISVPTTTTLLVRSSHRSSWIQFNPHMFEPLKGIVQFRRRPCTVPCALRTMTQTFWTSVAPALAELLCGSVSSTFRAALVRSDRVGQQSGSPASALCVIRETCAQAAWLMDGITCRMTGRSGLTAGNGSAIAEGDRMRVLKKVVWLITGDCDDRLVPHWKYLILFTGRPTAGIWNTAHSWK